MTIHWKAVEQHFTVVLFFNFTQFVILENLSILDLALLGVKGYKRYQTIGGIVSKETVCCVGGKVKH